MRVLKRIAVALAVALSLSQMPTAFAVTEPDPPQSPPSWCSLDGKQEFWLWRVAVNTADRGLMYQVCRKGVMTWPRWSIRG